MCGIVGIRRFDGTSPSPATLQDMAATLKHRGPDGDGYLVRGGVGLGHRRLSIIDLAHSQQPMSSADGRTHVTFNGEILNYPQLRGALTYPYRTQGDTEVLLAAHAAHGPAGVAKLVGQFAYALFDENTDELWLHRDRLGVLPLYYHLDDTQLVFASEIKALLRGLGATPDVDLASVADYLGRRSVRAPWTLLDGVRKLEPGTSLRVDAAGRAEHVRYWSLPGTPARPMSDDEAVDALHTALTTAVDRCLVADVPVGAYLSGGLDSSVVVALMQRSAQRGTGPIATFAAGFGDERHDELPWARQVSSLFGTAHHEVHVGTDDFLELWEPLTWHRDAPVSEPSDIAVHRLAQLAAQHVKVVLSGEGADELFAGYPKHRYAAATRLVGRVPHGARVALLNPLQRALPPRLARPRIALRALSERTEQERLSAWFAPFLRPEIAELLGANHAADRPLQELRTDPLDSMLAADVATWLPDNLLERGDRMSMAASLELRPPFLDVDVVELAFAMPAALKVRNGQGKWALRRLASRYLPTAVLERPKVGFRVPMDAWFRTGLRELARERLTDPSSLAVELFDRRVVEQLLRDHETARRNEEQRIWTLLSLEVWNSVCRRGGFSSAPPATIGGGLTCRSR